MSEYATQPPPPPEELAPMTEAQFSSLLRQIIQEMVGTPLAAMHEDVRRIGIRLDRVEHRVDGHGFAIDDVKREIAELRRRLDVLEKAYGTSGA